MQSQIEKIPLESQNKTSEILNFPQKVKPSFSDIVKHTVVIIKPKKKDQHSKVTTEEFKKKHRCEFF